MSQVKEILDQRKITYNPQGQDLVISCINPEHDDSNPSMRVDAHTGIFNCFSCGYKGNIFFELGEKPHGIEIDRLKLLKELEEIERLNLGLQFPASAQLVQTAFRGINEKTLTKFRAFTHEEFPNRVMFPIADVSGKIMCFHGRHIDQFGKPKYLNHPRKVPLPLFPISATPIRNRVILVEGIFDMLNLHQHGLTNAICCFGTNNCDREKLQLLKLRGVTGIDIFFDNDEHLPKNAGQDAAEKLRGIAETLGFSTINIKFKDLDAGALTQEQILKLKEQLYG